MNSPFASFPTLLKSIGTLTALFVSLAALPAQAQQQIPAFAPGEVLIQFKPGANEHQKANAMARVAGRLKERIHTPSMKRWGKPDLNVVGVPGTVPQAVQILRQLPFVAFAEPNWKRSHQALSNDPGYTRGHLWGLYGDATEPGLTNPYGSQAGEAWAVGHTGSHEVVVGVIDEGIQVQHPDLQANLWVNPFDPAGDANGDGSLDDDGNGYPDDVNGWDFYSGDNSVYDAGGDYHGTHVAGTVGAVGGNGAGVVGVNWKVTIISAKFLGPDGGYDSDAIKAIDYFTDLKVRHGLNVVALNNSWGGGGYSQALHDAILRAARQEILFIAAAGNGGEDGIGDNNDVTFDTPSGISTLQGTTTEAAANYEAVLSVAAINSTGGLAGFSNYGASSVDLGAPGVSIVSTLPDSGYGTASGTSMAAPHVTGAAALYASTHPGATAAQIRNALLTSVIPTASLTGKTVTGGRLDLSGIITPSLSAPTELAASAGHEAVALSWTASTGAVGYTVKRSLTIGGPYEDVAAGVLTPGYTDTSVVNGTTYYYVVTASGAFSESGPSNEVSATPRDTIAPTASINAPVNGATVSGRISIRAAATDNDRIYGVYFYAGGALLGMDKTADPYIASWDTTKVPDGTYTLAVVSKDWAGNWARAEIIVTVDNTRPTAAILAPANGAIVSGRVSIQAEATDNIRMYSVYFYAGGALLGMDKTADPYIASWDTTKVPDGTYTLAVVSKDWAGNWARAETTVTVDNIPG